MSSEGVETLKLVARRSLWIIVLLVVLGAALMTYVRQSQGPEYRASASVVLSPIDLAYTVPRDVLLVLLVATGTFAVMGSLLPARSVAKTPVISLLRKVE